MTSFPFSTKMADIANRVLKILLILSIVSVRLSSNIETYGKLRRFLWVKPIEFISDDCRGFRRYISMLDVVVIQFCCLHGI